MPQLQRMGYAHPQSNITKLVRDLRANGYEVEYDRRAGTMCARADQTVVVQAFKHHQRWALSADPMVITPIYA
jgi:hypothetical protein